MKFSRKEILTFSNFLSVLRLLLVIPFWILLEDLHNESVRYTVAALSVFAALTDVLDGYFARKQHEVTEVGKIIDPLADKILVGLIIIKLFLVGEIPAYYFLMVIGRDLIIFFGGIYVTSKIGKVLPSNVLGKIAVISISLVILFVVLFQFHIVWNNLLFKALYGLSILLIFASLYAYIIRAIEFLRQKNYESV